MNQQQLNAIRQPCLLGFENMHPHFGRMRGSHSEVLTVNTGYE